MWKRCRKSEEDVAFGVRDAGELVDAIGERSWRPSAAIEA